MDASGRAIERARQKAGPAARALFRVFDVMQIEGMRTVFDTVVDCGMMHGLTDAGWTAYATALSRVIRPGGMLHVLCFSDAEPDWGGPRRVRQDELRALFCGGWWIDEIREAHFETVSADKSARAWMCSVEWHGQPAPGVQ